MHTFSQGTTRKCVQQADMMESLAKDSYRHMKPGMEHTYTPQPQSIYIAEKYHDQGRPDKDFQARMRENDSSPPFDVTTGCYVPRDNEIGTKRAMMSGTLGKAPWRHGTDKD